MLLSLLYVLISGVALPVGGIQMQYLWRNQLWDVYSLGLGSAACLGAAAATMFGWCSLSVGSFICTLICVDIMAKYQIDMYAAGRHRRGSKAVERYTNMEIREDFALRDMAFRQPAYKVDKDLNVLE